jgi:tetratricopeptide (TPR) repeat protein
MYIQKLTIQNIRALKRFEMTFPEKPIGWHVIIGDNGAGKSTLIRAISLGLIGPNEVRAANPNFSEWLRKDSEEGSVELVVGWDEQYDINQEPSSSNNITAKVLLQPSLLLDGSLDTTPLVEAVADKIDNMPSGNVFWNSSSKGWFSAGFGPFRRFTGGDAERDKVYSSSPRCGAHLSVFGEDVALTEALRWLQKIDYQQLKAREAKTLDSAEPSDKYDSQALSADPEPKVMDEVRQLWQIASRLRENGLFTEAESLLRQALALAEKVNEPGHHNIATGIHNLASLLLDTNRIVEAEPLVRQALTINEAKFGPNHHRITNSLINLATLLKTTNRLAEAEQVFRRALAIDEASFGPNDLKVAVSLNNLAHLLQDTNQLTEAETLLRRALAIDEASLGLDHHKVALRLNNLSALLQDTNQLVEAESLQRRAVAINEAYFGPSHIKMAPNLNNLAYLLKYTNRLDEAESLYRRALAISESSFGPDHPNVATNLNNLAGLLEDTNRLDEAESLYRRALAISESSFGPDHPNVATNLSNLGCLLQDTGRLAEGELLIRRALAIDEASFGPNHPNVSIRLNNLASLFRETGRLSEAEVLLRRSLNITEESFGPDHPSVATRLNNLANLLRATDRLVEAESLYRRCLIIDEAIFAPDHPAVVTALGNLLSLLQDTGRSEEADALAKRHEEKRAALPVRSNIISHKLPLDENEWLALQLRTFINESKLLPTGTEFKGMSAEGPIFRDSNGQTVPVTQLSDGFRSILSLAFELIRQLIHFYGLAAVFPPNSTYGVIALPGVVLIDEVDTHLHPTWQTRIGQWFTKCFPQLQFIVTSHSPLICRAVTEDTGSIWRLPTPGQGQEAEEVTGVERQRLRLGTVLDAYGTGLFGGHEVEQAAEATALLTERASLSAKEAVGKLTAAERKRLRELQQLFLPVDAEVEY